MPTTRNAKGPDAVVASEVAKRTWTLQVKSFSKRDPVPLGKDPHIVADWVIVCIRVRTDSPRCFVIHRTKLASSRVATIVVKTYWLEPPQYDTEEFAERWDRIGSGLA
jgi:hypothetical protein